MDFFLPWTFLHPWTFSVDVYTLHVLRNPGLTCVILVYALKSVFTCTVTSLVWTSLAEWLYSITSPVADHPPISVTRLMMFDAWLAVVAVVHLLGVLLQRTCQPVAVAIVDWLCRPFLLLYAIVFSTIGFYINVYSLDLRPLWTTVVIAFAPPATGLGVGALAAAVGSRLAADEGAGWAIVASEAAVMNCGAVLTMIRLGVASDVDADVLSSPALWTTFATPLTLMLAAASRRLVCTVARQLQLIDDQIHHPSSKPPDIHIEHNESAQTMRSRGISNSHQLTAV